MGQKVHPVGFRLGSYKTWLSRWHDEQNYADLLHKDLAIRHAIESHYKGAGISRVEIERGTGEITVIINTARPGIVIGRGGQRVDEMRELLQKLTMKKIHLNIQEIREPDLDAYLVARNIADQLERRISYRRALKRAIAQTMEAGAKGIKVSIGGRLGGQEIARRVTEHQGSVPLHTLCADIDYGLAEARTNTGKVGVKVWVYKGNIVPEPRRVTEVGVLEPVSESLVPEKPALATGQGRGVE
ncbi:30S ribosomal protein S3 [Dehalococcoidia bacterium]|nr:30S ribosomal protein S3 [Dehalococcoidia bacterium]MCL0078344.1 30S ribosomal protein S3 [Dehalococcoidia bacterium]MCL0089989.1 30S ribosomal protein S3 [Dehalococcoidia bacterium]MCL0093529.1 30S ribosomal protein S3 [Dehalococcoidia bacterium]